MKPPPWPAERVALALALIDEGRNYREVAAELGITRSAIAGMLHRHRPRRAPPSLEERLGWARVVATGCRWIEGHPGAGEWTWCGAPLEPGRPYCAEHEARVWLRVPAFFSITEGDRDEDRMFRAL